MKLVSCLLFSFLLEIHNTKRISNPKHVKRIHPKKTISSWHIVNLDNTKSLHQLLSFTEKTATNMAIGNPEQRFTIQLDTGSKDSWVFSKEYNSIEANYLIVTSNHNLYDKNASSTHTIPSRKPYPEVIKYSRGWTFGYLENDTFTVLGTKFDAKFYGAVKSGLSVAKDKYDGVMGLQYDPTNGNFIRTLCTEKQKKEINRFAIYYRRHFDTEMDSGMLVVCDIDTNLYNTSSMHWVKEANHGTWKIEIQSARIYDKRGNVTFKAPFKASLESASNEIWMPEEDYNLFYDNLTPYFNGNPRTAEFDCEFDKDFPEIILNIEGKEYTIDGFDYTYETQFHVIKNCTIVVKKSPSKTEWSLGSPFLRKFYTAFDMNTHQVGFAELIRKEIPFKTNATGTIL